MKKLIILFLLVVGLSSAAQVAINTDGASPDNSAMMDVKSSDKGILIPRLTNAGRNLIPSPATGLLIYNTSTNLFNYYNGSTWCQIESTLVSSTTGMLSSGGGVSINVIPDTPPDNSAMLDINNSSRGVLFPRTTPELISSPANGLIIYNTSTNRIEYFRNNVWVSLSASLIGVPGAGGNQSSVGLAIKQNNSDPDPSAILDVEANDKGVLIPRLTEVQRNEILPVIGLTVYNLTSNAIEYYNGKGWYRLNVNFSCGQPFSDIRDTTIYNTVQIGDQCWLKENLHIGKMITGGSYMGNNSFIEKFCYNNDTTFCNEYGGLYQWNEAMQYTNIPGIQGICPTGWHIPTNIEWGVLNDALGGQSVAGGKLKETGLVHWNSPNTGATNSSGFSALGAGGWSIYNGAFAGLKDACFFWLSQYSGYSGYAYSRLLRSYVDDV